MSSQMKLRKHGTGGNSRLYARALAAMGQAAYRYEFGLAVLPATAGSGIGLKQADDPRKSTDR